MAQKPPKRADLAILTIIPEAYDAVVDVFGVDRYHERDGYEWAWSYVGFGSKKLAVVVGLALDRENIAAATFTNAFIGAWEPTNLMLVDIGGAVAGRDDVQLGDVVVHTFLHYYDFKKEGRSRKDSPRNLPHAAASSKLRELSRRPSLRRDGKWAERVNSHRPKKGTPKVLPGEMLAGGTLFANSPRLHALLKAHPKVLAVEMEGAGVARGVLDRSIRGIPPEFLIVRGMSDFCNVPPDENQRARDKWKNYACYVAASHALDIAEGLPPSNPNPPGASGHGETDLGSVKSNIWSVPNRKITGRDDELRRTRDFFTSGPSPPGSSVVKALAIVGEAGIGKSALAREAVEALSHEFDLVWWINGENPLRMRAGLRDLARTIGLKSASFDSPAEQKEETARPKFLEELRIAIEDDPRNSEILFVIDNVDDANVKRNIERELLIYLPAVSCCVLFTSQSRRWHPIAETISLGGLSKDEAVALVAEEAQRVDLSESQDVAKIAVLFGCKPLFLKVIASVLSEGGDPASLRTELEESSRLGLTRLPESGNFDPLWRSIYSIALKNVERLQPGAQRVAEVICSFSAEPIPEELVSAITESVEGKDHLLRCLGALYDRSLIERNSTGEPNYQMHRAISSMMQTLLIERGDFQSAVELSSICLTRSFPAIDSLSDIKGRPEILNFASMMEKIGPHLSTLLKCVLENLNKNLSQVTLRNAVRCCDNLGLHYWMTSEWSQLKHAYEDAARLLELSGDHAAAALRRVRLGNVYRQIGRFDEARNLIDQNLPTIEKHGEKLDYAWAISAQARLLRNKPDAEPQLALDSLNVAYGLFDDSELRNSPPTRRMMSSINNYRSVILRQLGKLEAAEEESVSGLRTLTGQSSLQEILSAGTVPDDELVATHIRALGAIQRSRGNFELSMKAHETALGIFDRVYQRDHNDIIRALDSLGRVQREWGAFDDAKDTFSRASDLTKRLLGESHAHVATAAVNLALTYLELDQPEEAYDCALEGCKIYESAYDDDGSNFAFRNDATAWAYFVKSEALAKLGDYENSKHAHGEILEWRKIRYGVNHPLVASSMFALAEVKLSTDEAGNHGDALALHQTALSIRRVVFGDEPNFWLSQSLSRLGYLVGNIDMVRDALTYFQKYLAPDHWRTVQCIGFLSLLEKNLPKP